MSSTPSFLVVIDGVIPNDASCLFERSIFQDGMLWRERVARSLRRQSETHSAPEMERLGTWHKGDAPDRSEFISNNPGRPDHSNARGKTLFVAHSAPEFALSRLLAEASS